MTWYSELFWIIALCFVGAVAYVADWKYGSRARRWWHNFSHSDSQKITEDEATGFIYKRPLIKKVGAAVFICLAQSILSLKYATASAFSELVSSPFEILVILLGFWIAPTLYFHWKKRDDIFEKAEHIGKDFNLSQWSRELWEAVRSLKFRWPSSNKSAARAMTSTNNPKRQADSPPASEPLKPAEPEKSPGEIIREFARKHGGSR